MDLEKIIGMSDIEAIRLLVKHGIKHRISSYNRKGLMLTRDFVPERVNLEVVDSRVVRFTKG